MSTAQAKAQKGDLDDSKPKNSGVADYLSAPKRKRKNFFVLAFSEQFDQETARSIQAFCKAQYPKHAVAVPRSRDEFIRQFTRNLSLVVMDDNFLPIKESIEVIKLMKERKSEAVVPVLFLTKNQQQLVSMYNQSLSAHFEADEFVDYMVTPKNQILSRVKYGVDNKFQRRTKRFKMDIPIEFYILSKNEQTLKGRLLDISSYGCLLKTDTTHVFSKNDQIRVHIPITNYLKDFDEECGDFLKLPADVKAVDISGDRVSLEWANLNDRKMVIVNRFVSTLFEKHISKVASSTRARLAKIPIMTR